LAAKNSKSWETVRGQKPLNEKRVAAYERVMDAEQLIAEARYRRGVSHAAITDALAVSEPDGSGIEQEEDLYLSILGRYVEALGGHLEVRAVFPEETINLLREPDQAGASDSS
jgi:hypothetical protein